MPRQITRADFEAVYKQYADKAIKRFNLTGNHPPQLFTVKLGKEPGQIERSGSLNRLAPQFFNGTMHKDVLRLLLQQLTTPGSEIRKVAGALGVVVPDIVVQINEIWLAKNAYPEGMSPEEARKQARKQADEGPRPSERPDREEGIAVWLHTQGYTTAGLCPILDKPRRHAELAALPPEETLFEGRFSMQTQDEA
jgi:hypothetical protein